MVNFGDGGDGAFAAAARDALFDADGGWDSGDEIDIRAGHLLDELPGVDVHGIEEAALSLGEKEIEGQRAFARAAHPGDDHETIAGNVEGKVFEVVFARAVNGDLPVWAGKFVGVGTHGSFLASKVRRAKI